MYLYKRIRKLRIEKEISQHDLAKGIISPSHISNFENGRYKLSDDILIALARKMDVPQNYFLKCDSIDYDLEKLLLTLKEHLDKRNLLKSYKILQYIIKKFPFIFSIHQEIHFYLLKAIYHFKDQNIEKVRLISEKEIKPLINENDMEFLPFHIKEAYFYFKGAISYFDRDYLQSYKYYNKQLDFVRNNLQKSTVFYNLGIVLYRLGEITNAISFTRRALDLYLTELMWDDMVSAYNLLGALYWENNELNLAEYHLQKGLNILDRFNDPSMLGKIYHNLGLVYRSRKDYEKALEYLNKSLDIKKINKLSDVSITCCVIIDIYLELKLIENAERVMKEAQKLPLCQQDEIFELKTLQAKIILEKGDKVTYESIMLKCFDYFLENNLRDKINLIAKDLGDYYFKNRKYKKACQYYQITFQYNKK